MYQTQARRVYKILSRLGGPISHTLWLIYTSDRLKRTSKASLWCVCGGEVKIYGVEKPFYPSLIINRVPLSKTSWITPFPPELFTDLFSELCVVATTTTRRKAQQTGRFPFRYRAEDLLVGGLLFLNHSQCPTYSLVSCIRLPLKNLYNAGRKAFGQMCVSRCCLMGVGWVSSKGSFRVSPCPSCDLHLGTFLRDVTRPSGTAGAAGSLCCKALPLTPGRDSDCRGALSWCHSELPGKSPLFLTALMSWVPKGHNPFAVI